MIERIGRWLCAHGLHKWRNNGLLAWCTRKGCTACEEAA